MPITHPGRHSKRFVRWVEHTLEGGMSNLLETLPSESLVVYGTEVRYPKEFGGLFNREDKILELHINPVSTKAIDSVTGLKDRIPLLKEKGIVGAFGDTPNERLIEFVKAARKVFEVQEDSIAEREMVLPEPKKPGWGHWFGFGKREK